MSLIHARHKAAKSNFTRRRMLLMIHERNLRRAWKRVHNFNLECLINSCDFLLPTAKQAAATFDRFAGENNEASVGGTRRKLSEHVSPVDNHALSSSCLEGSSGNRRHMLDACKSPNRTETSNFRLHDFVLTFMLMIWKWFTKCMLGNCINSDLLRSMCQVTVCWTLAFCDDVAAKDV